MKLSRSSGILLHPTSLAGPFGVGDLGPAAYAFADFLEAAGQSLWQVLPLGPTGPGNSPYACYSAFAGNTLLISPEQLVTEGLIEAAQLEGGPAFASESVDFDSVNKHKTSVLRQAFANFKRDADPELSTAFNDFCRHAVYWLEDYALFCALKDAHNGAVWNQWEAALVHREGAALETAREDFNQEIEAQKFYQFLFYRQWFALKADCNRRGIKLIGDIPIFVAHDSADVWTNQDQFKLNEKGYPTVVAGVPPDYFSASGQHWGNPLYNWNQIIAGRFRWWIQRVHATLEIFDIARLDHFRGFAAAWEIPGEDTTAERGRWVEAPGRELFTAIKEELGETPIIAEDLGVITPDVEKLRDDFNFPGMRVLQFAFSSDANNNSLPHNYQQHLVVYTGTHDNDTTVGWFADLAAAEREFCLKYLNSAGEEINWDFIRALFASVANTAIVPLQDVLGLGTEARMNLPNSTEGNWSWRVKQGALTSELAKRLRELAELYGRRSRAEQS
uniref:4-alpha-glucanotransferase n=1 Tax=uncultured bacterium 253 TaxID=698385 RepID=E3T739_9BACT|nr:4-alpha-glucanotransferase [uncultured bacterium 253]